MAVAGLAVGKPRIESQVKYLFGESGRDGLAPTLVLKNPGRDITGRISITTFEVKTVIPFSLASGATQQFEIPASVGSISQMSLETNEGNFPLDFLPPERNSQGALVAVGDEKGAYRFTAKTLGKTSVAVLDANPAAMPTRFDAYAGVSVIVLGHGAVRMSDESIRILRLAALKNRNLVFIGGPGAPWWQDERWKDLLPAQAETSPVTVDGGQVVGSAKGQPASILKLTAAPDANPVIKNGLVLGVSRAYGLGRVSVTAFDPAASPFQSTEDRETVFAPFLDRDNVPEPESEAPPAPRRRRGGRFGPRYMSPVPNDPFKIDLPAAGDVALILVVYAVLVAPVNLLLLRRINRPEWAWLTVPLLSGTAAALILLKSQSLYKNGASTAVQGSVTLTQGQELGVAQGVSDVFFPNAGLHPVPVDNLLALTSYSSGSTFGAAEPLTVLDDGRHRQAVVSTSNLAFRRYVFRQAVEAKSFLRAERVSDHEIRVTNLSTRSMSGVRVNELAETTLAPGETKVLVSVGEPQPHAIPSPANQMDGDDVGAASTAELPDADIIHAYQDEAAIGVDAGTRRPTERSVRIEYVLPKREVKE